MSRARRAHPRFSRWARATLFCALAPTVLVAAPAAGAADARSAAAPGAAAWVVRLELAGAPLVELGRTSVDASTGEVRATALAIGGEGPPVASADPTTPEARAALVDWTDSTGSLTVTGSYAEARSGEHRWSARAGLGQSTGTGFPLASMLLTWDQQTQFLATVQAFNDAVTPVVDQSFSAVAPLLALLGLPAPHFSPIAPAGLIDAGGGRAAGSTAEAVTTPGYASARADAVAGALELFGGFVSVDAVSSEAAVERGSSDQTVARSSLTGVEIAGIPVQVDAAGIRVAGGGPLEALLTPVFDGLLGQLAAAGLTIRTTASPAGAPCCAAAAMGLELAFAAPSGPLVVSIGGAEATAPDPLPRVVAAAAPAPPAAVAPSGDAPATSPPAATRAATPAVGAEPTLGTVPAPQPARPRIGVIAGLGADVVRALRTTYLILAGAGIAGAALFAIAGPARPARSKRGLP